MYHHTVGSWNKAFGYMNRALLILKVVCGENHPDIAACYLNTGLMYKDVEKFHMAIDCYKKSLYCNI
jgi:tetratricopeptide (TPR) repeat protein